MQAKEKGIISAHSYMEIKAEEFEAAGHIVPTIGGVCVCMNRRDEEKCSLFLSVDPCA